MGDNEYQQSFRGLSDHDFASRSLSLTEHQSQHGLENPAAAHYQAPMTMAPSQPSSLAVKTGQPSLNHMEPMHYQTPMTMWHHVPSQQSNLAAMSMIPQAQQQNAAALSMMLQSQGLRYYPAPVKLFPQALQQTQNSQFYHASVACSKRFSEEEKQKLEKVFTDETQKPSTSRKRQLAEELGCPVPKVNNWFQNRRAREKQMHRVQAYEASQAADRAASGNDGADAHVAEDEDDEDAVNSESDSMSTHSQTMKSSLGRFTETDDSSGHENPSPDSYDGHDSDGFVTDSPARSSGKVGNTADETGRLKQAIKLEPESPPQLQLVGLDLQLNCSTFDSQQGIFSSSSPETYSDAQDGTSFDAIHGHFVSSYSSMGDMSGLEVLDGNHHSGYFPPSTPFMVQRTPTISTSMVGHDEMDHQSARRPSDVSNFSGLESLSPNTIAQASPPMEQTDLAGNQGSPNASIASRRKIRPPQRLNQVALRNYPNGPKTGVEGGKRAEIYGTMRRAASANGPLSGKIFKSGPPVSPLSPRSFDPNFLEQLARNSSLTTSSSLKDASNASPARPALEQRYLSADNSGLGIQHRSSSLSLNSFGERMTLSPRIAQHARETPLAAARHPSFQHFPHPKFTLDTGCGNVSPDEALTTPGLSQFGSELEFPTSLSAPRYVESEPATPSYVPVAIPTSTAAQGHGFPTLKIETPPQTDVFPWSRSPDQMSIWSGSLGHFGEPQSQNFQFQPNVTPQNFNSPTGA